MQASKKILLTSSAFEEGDMIPKKYTSQGENINPPLAWENIPPGTKSLSLIVDDPDAPTGLWTHWLVKNIPKDKKGIEENTIPGEEIPNSWDKKGWGGPMPPSGTHRYFFKLYALDIDHMKANTKSQFYKEVEKHKIAEGHLMGLYQKH